MRNHGCSGSIESTREDVSAGVSSVDCSSGLVGSAVGEVEEAGSEVDSGDEGRAARSCGGAASRPARRKSVPQLLQKLEPALFAVPQWGQTVTAIGNVLFWLTTDDFLLTV